MVCKSHYVTKESSPGYIKNSVQLNRKETNSPAETGAKDFTKEDIRVADKRRRKMVNRRGWVVTYFYLNHCGACMFLLRCSAEAARA